MNSTEVSGPIRTIDFAALRGGNHSSREALGREIVTAFEEIGGIYAINHGVDPVLVEDAFTASRWFFAQPLSWRQALGINQWQRGFLALQTNRKPGFPPDLREAFDIGIDIPADDPRVRGNKPFHGPNHWPDAPGFRSAVERYFQALRDFGFALQEALALGLGLPNEWFQEYYGNALSTMRLLHYPNAEQTLEADGFPMAPHIDFGAFSFISQDGTGGLEYQDSTELWRPLQPTQGALVVFLGGLMNYWSNGLFKALRHRVVTVPGRQRFSIAMFYNPNFDAELTCPPSCGSANQPLNNNAAIACGPYILAQAKARSALTAQ